MDLSIIMLSNTKRQKEYRLYESYIRNANSSRETESGSVVLWRKRQKIHFGDDRNVYNFNSDDSFPGLYIC